LYIPAYQKYSLFAHIMAFAYISCSDHYIHFSTITKRKLVKCTLLSMVFVRHGVKIRLHAINASEGHLSRSLEKACSRN